ncbi:MAG TPA: type 2 isopentenyl-diphosphate Delta-isomerase [Nitrososphaeraceae archaeon]|nr:type 2 isopentenyl-diphosphate Delta-isomerase [Nitrososphaeraceae archaeon]
MPDTSDFSSDIDIISQRKREGIEIPLHRNVQARSTSTHLEFVKFVHNALPEIDYDEIDTSTTFLNSPFRAPIIIDSMTGGTNEATKINARLGNLAEKYGFAMGVGSQRAGLLNEKMADTYLVARRNAPSAFLIANIGGAQLAKGLGIHEIEKIIDMIKANALAIHLNPLQELIQPEGEPKYKGVLERISDVIKDVSVPVIVKEVGAGISKEVALRLEKVGISAINVAGTGGTSWAAVEKIRAESVMDSTKIHLGELFWDWGIPTALSVMEVASVLKQTPIIASGGLRSGLDMAKCIALGSTMCAMAYPFLRQADESMEKLLTFADTVLAELKSTMFLIGARNVQAIKSSRYILTGALATRVEDR